MRNLIIYCIEGYSSFIDEDKFGLSNLMSEVCCEFSDSVYDYSIVDSRIFFDYRKHLKYLLEKSKQLEKPYLFLVGKSMGAVNLLSLLSKLFSTRNKFEKISSVFIDAHSIFPSFYGSLREIIIKEEWKNKNAQFYGVFQHNKYPKGANIKNSSICINLTGFRNDDGEIVNHFNIINHPIVKDIMYSSIRLLTNIFTKKV